VNDATTITTKQTSSKVDDVLPRTHPMRRIRTIADMVLTDIVDALGAGVGRTEAAVLVRACVLGSMLGLRTPTEILEEMQRSAVARWFVGAAPGATPTASAIATTRRALARDTEGQWFLQLVGALTSLTGVHGTRSAPTGITGLEFRDRIERASIDWRLTARQTDVLCEVARGRNNKEIAEQLGCAPGTVELHVTALLQKSRSHGRANLVARFWLGF
jgi:DNA-binding CsgD family transcriptional regulator